MPTLLQIAALHPGAQSRLEADYTVIRANLPEIDDAWLASQGGEIDGVVTGGHLGLPAKLMTALPRLKVVGINGVGFDKVDLDLAKSRGIRVSNTPDVLTDDVADLAVGLTLSLLRRLPHAHAHVQGGKWPTGEMPLASKLSGKRIGIFGLGRIGRAAAKRFAGFTDHIGYTDMARHDDVPFTYYPDPVALAGSSDVFVVCAAASTSTRKLIGSAVFKALGPKGVLVNVARGSIVDEEALVQALQDGTLGGAALDVFEDEPNVPAALRSMDHVIVTPHIASGTHETRQAMGSLMLDNLDAFFAGKPMPTALV
ncbi:MAG: 2-hydroxyacid dehydrogenase [Janthinobacterium lividum]